MGLAQRNAGTAAGLAPGDESVEIHHAADAEFGADLVVKRGGALQVIGS